MKMKVKFLPKIGVFLLVLVLCGVSFVVGHSATGIGKPTAHATKQMNELDRLQLETASKK